MRRVLYLLTIFICASLKTVAQTIENPVFDRTDIPAFHVDKVTINKDATIIQCSYAAEANSWANISEDTYLLDTKTNIKYPIQKSEGFPFSPEQKKFLFEERCEVTLYFPSFIPKGKLDLIENKDERAFNVYGINLKQSYKTVCSYEQYYSCCQEASRLDSLGNTDEAIVYRKEQLEIAKCLYGLQSHECAIALYDLCLYNESNSNTAIIYGEQSLRILKELPSTDIIKRDIARICESLMTLYLKNRNYEKGFYYGEESLSLRKELTSGVDPFYINFLDRLIHAYGVSGYSSNAAFHSKEQINVYRDISKEDPDYICSYITALLNAGDLYIETNNTEELKKCTEEANVLLGDNKCDDPETLFHAYNNLAFTVDGDVDKAIGYLMKAKETANKYEIAPGRHAQTLRILGNTYAHLKSDTLNAIKCYEEAVSVLKNDSNNNLAQLAQLYDALGLIYYKKDSIKSQNYYEQYTQIIGDLYGKESIMFGNALSYKSIREFWSYLKNKENKDDLVSDVCNSSRIIKRYLDMAMLSSTNKERIQLWQKYCEFFDWWIPNVAYFLDSDETTALAYDASLFYKGYMMGMDNDIKMQLLENESDFIKSLYAKYISNLNNLERINNYPSSQFIINIDSLKSVIIEDEVNLTKAVYNSGFKFNKANLSWNDIQSSLNDNDIVIEFVSFKGINKKISDEFYMALVLNNKMSAPKMIRLFKKDELDSLLNVPNPNYNEISSLIWSEPLLIELNGFENVYFSPAGCLNSIGIEYFSITSGETMNNKYHMYRLSSSRELYNRNNKVKLNNAVIYGNLDYNWKQDEIVSGRITGNNNIIGVSRAYVDSISSRGGFDMLENTKDEISEISKVLSKSGIENTIYSGKTGTEESFKYLSGKEINIIHLATHGMYVSQDDALLKKSKQNFVFINSDDDDNTIISDKSLTRSVLIMSGGNKLLMRDSIGWEEEDEIMTALEISTLNMQKLDLVVLSACQTALGDIESEGVFGLQRGFKKAGANSLLLSLGKVDDEATKILMVEFYKNLMNGKTKHQSLKDAQKHLRQVDNGKYDKPQYWASFIMLDGLN